MTPTLTELKARHRREMGDISAPAPAPLWQTITLSLPADTKIAVPTGRWEQRDGRIVATYTREELTWAVALALGERQRRLEARLEALLAEMEAATGCDDAEAERLLARWDAVEAELLETEMWMATV